MNLLRKLFGKKPQPVSTPAPLAKAPVVKEKPVISLDIVATTHDETRLVELALNGETSQLRQAAATKIAGRAALEQLLKQLKNKDKTVLKLVRTKLDEFKAADSLQADLDKQGLALVEKIERHIHQEADAVFKAKLGLIDQEFLALREQLSTQIGSRYDAAKQRCDEKIAAQAQAIALQEDQAAAIQQARQLAQDARDNLEAIAVGLINEPQLSDDAIKVAHLRLDELSQALRLAKSQVSDLTVISAEFETRKQQVLNFLHAITEYGTLTAQAEQLRVDIAPTLNNFSRTLNCFPRDFINASPVACAALDVFNALQQAQQQTLDAQHAQRKALAELLRRSLIAVNNGQVRKARAQARDLESMIAASSEPLPAALQAKYDDFLEKLAKLGDWHDFAVTPKKQQLVADARALIGAAIAPDVLAERIHELQDDWREVSRGGQQQDDDVWQQFQTACAEAYAPCKDYFDAQALQRSENLQKRSELVETLRNYITQFDWQQANWKNVEQTLKVARSEWQSLWPVPRKAGADLSSAFEALMDDLHGRIKGEYDANKLAKVALVNQAKAFHESADLNAAIEGVKTLQQQWKTIGKTWHREDQQLWNQLRETSDAIFARRQAQQQEKRGAEQALQAQARALADDYTALAQRLEQAALTDEELSEQTAALDARTDALGAAGKEAFIISAAQQTLARARDQQLQQARSAQQAQARVLQTQLADAVNALELAQIAGEDTESAAAALSAQLLESAIPAALKSALNHRLSQRHTLDASSCEQATAALRLLAIRAEILRGQESIAADKALRMNYQVSLMQQGLGQPQADFAELERAWWAVGGAPASAYQAYSSRFFAN